LKNLFGFMMVLVALLGVPLLAADEAGPSFKAKVWDNDGHIWILDHMVDRGVGGEWRYWAPGEEGTLFWDDVDWVVFEENLHPNRHGPWDREMPQGRRARVRLNNGEIRHLYIAVQLLHGKDAYGARKIYGDDVTRIDFLETYKPLVKRCPNGHVWPDEGYNFCPFDGQPVTQYEQY